VHTTKSFRNIAILRKPFASKHATVLFLWWLGCAQEVTTPKSQPTSTSSTSTSQTTTKPALNTDPNSCAECHQKQVAEWQKSRHAQAFLDGVFLHEFNPKRQVWCIKCHSPLVQDPTNVDDNDPLVTQGVGCLGCHQHDGQFVSSEKKEGSPHQTIVDQKFGSPSFCGPCHDFNFPILDNKGVLKHYTPHPMQETWRQYKESGLTLGCLKCHTAHESKGAHDLTKLKSALDFSVCAEKSTIKFGFFNKGAGHHVPSGGIDRHMLLDFWSEKNDKKKLRALIGRTFERVPSGGKKTIEDTSVKPKEWQWFQASLADLKANKKTPLQVQVRYIYAPSEDLKVENATISQIVFEEKFTMGELGVCPSSTLVAKELVPIKK
jgi:hypothetical protein